MNIITKIKKLDDQLTKTRLSLLKKEGEKASFEEQNQKVLAKLEEYRMEIKKLKEEIESIKAEILTQYILGNLEEPIIGARHTLRTIKDIEIINKKLVPEEYKDVNISKIKRDINDLIIPGIKVIEKKIIVFKWTIFFRPKTLHLINLKAILGRLEVLWEKLT